MTRQETSLSEKRSSGRVDNALGVRSLGVPVSDYPTTHASRSQLAASTA